MIDYAGRLLVVRALCGVACVDLLICQVFSFDGLQLKAVCSLSIVATSVS